MHELEQLSEGHVLIEGPRVDEANRLYFSDIITGGVFRRDPDGKMTHLIPERTWIGGIALNADGRLVLSGRGGLILFDPKTGRQEKLLEAVDGEPIGSINDIQPDDQGGVYAGLIDPAAQSGLKGKGQPLVLLTAKREVRRVAEDVKVSNGIALSPDGRTLYQAETTDGVLAYDRSANGSLGNRRLQIKHSLTDGIAVDEEGAIWLADPLGSAIFRYLPDGSRAEKIDVPVRWVTSVTLGGDDLRDLYIVTGSALNEANYEKTGRVYRTRVKVPGLPTPKTRF